MTYPGTFYEDYVVGTVREFGGRTITADDIAVHAEQTGDFFPHHMDAEWCATQPFKRRIAHGTLVLSVAVGMTATDVNPEAMTYGYDRIRFVHPVFIDDTISVRAEITARSDHRRHPGRFGLVEEDLRVTNQDGEVVLALVHLYLVNKRSDPARAEQAG